METLTSFASALDSIIVASNELYEANFGEPAPGSTAATDVALHDEQLAESTGTPRPVFGTYADAEAKLRALIDLTSSFSALVTVPNTNVGRVVVARSAIETAARMYWSLAVGSDYRERTARWLRERLRSIEEVSKFGEQSRIDMNESGFAKDITDGAKRAGLNVQGPPPAAIDLVWPLVSAPESPLKFDGIDREAAMFFFYRSPSATTHGSTHGLQVHFASPMEDESRRQTASESIESSLILMAGLFNGFANAHGALIALYGWDATVMRDVQSEVAQRFSNALLELLI